MCDVARAAEAARQREARPPVASVTPSPTPLGVAASDGRSPGDAAPTPASNTGGGSGAMGSQSGQNDALKRFGASTFLTLNNTKRKTALGV